MAALFVVTAGADALRERQPGPGPRLLVALVLVYTAVFVWVAMHLPSRATGWRPFVPGAVLVSVGIVLVHLSVSFYFAPKLGRSSELYGDPRRRHGGAAVALRRSSARRRRRVPERCVVGAAATRLSFIPTG